MDDKMKLSGGICAHNDNSLMREYGSVRVYGHETGKEYCFQASVSRFNYEPKEDITAYELALIIGAINGGFYAIESLPENAKRHFVKVV